MKRALFLTSIMVITLLAFAGCTAAGPDLKPQLNQLAAQNEQMAGQLAALEAAGGDAASSLPRRETLETLGLDYVADELAAAGRLGG